MRIKLNNVLDWFPRSVFIGCCEDACSHNDIEPKWLLVESFLAHRLDNCRCCMIDIVDLHLHESDFIYADKTYRFRECGRYFRLFDL